MSASLTPRLAKHIIQRVGEAGQPPDYGLSWINVGNQHYLDILAEEYLDRLLEGNRGSAFKLVQAYYGGGKTHFLHCLRDLAWQRGFLCSLVQLSPQECPYEDPLKVYRAVVSQLSSPPSAPGEESSAGLGDILRDFAEGLARRQSEQERQDWLKRVARKTRVDSVSFRRAILAFLQCCWEGDSQGETLLESWLRADPVPRQELKAYGIYEPIDGNNAFASLRSLCQALTGLGYPGLVLMFDEVDRNLSLNSRRIAALGDNLRQVIDLCGSAQLPGVLFLYAVPPEFLRLVVPEYPALDQRLRSPLPLSRISPQSTLIDLEKLQLKPEELLLAIGMRLLKVFETAQNWTATEAIQQGNLQSLARACAQYSFEVGHRRTFVKSWVAFLHQQQQSGESWMSEEMAEHLLTHGVVAPDNNHDFLDV